MHCRFHEIADQHVVEDLVFDRQHERMTRRFKSDSSIAPRAFHVDGVRGATDGEANKGKMISDMFETLNIGR